MLARYFVYDTSLQFGLPLTDDMLGMMMTWCTVEGGEVPSACGVAYEELVMLMDWRTPVQREKLLHGMNYSTLTGDETTIPAPPDGAMDVNIDTTPLEFDALLKTDKSTNLSPKKGTPFVDNEIFSATGTASAMEIKCLKSKNNTSYMCYQPTSGVIPTDHWRLYGVPTVHTDQPAPLIRRTDDTKVRVSHRAPALLTINNFSEAISGKWAAVIHPSPI